MLFNFQRGQTPNNQTANTGSPVLFMPERQISGYLPASSSIKNHTDLNTSYLSYISLYFLYISYISYISYVSYIL